MSDLHEAPPLNLPDNLLAQTGEFEQLVDNALKTDLAIEAAKIALQNARKEQTLAWQKASEVELTLSWTGPELRKLPEYRQAALAASAHKYREDRVSNIDPIEAGESGPEQKSVLDYYKEWVERLSPVAEGIAKKQSGEGAGVKSLLFEFGTKSLFQSIESLTILGLGRKIHTPAIIAEATVPTTFDFGEPTTAIPFDFEYYEGKPELKELKPRKFVFSSKSITSQFVKRLASDYVSQFGQRPVQESYVLVGEDVVNTLKSRLSVAGISSPEVKFRRGIVAFAPEAFRPHQSHLREIA